MKKIRRRIISCFFFSLSLFLSLSLRSPSCGLYSSILSKENQHEMDLLLLLLKLHCTYIKLRTEKKHIVYVLYLLINKRNTPPLKLTFMPFQEWILVFGFCSFKMLIWSFTSFSINFSINS